MSFPPNTDFSNETSDTLSEITGPKYPPSINADPVAYIDLFFTDTMVSETNRYAQQLKFFHMVDNNTLFQPHTIIRVQNLVLL